MLLTDVTKIIRVLLGAFETVASQDDLTQRRIDQIGQVIGAVEDVVNANVILHNSGEENMHDSGEKSLWVSFK